MHTLDFIRVLAKKHPTVQASCIGDVDTYANLVWEGGDPLPTEEELIASFYTSIREDMWEKIKAERDRRKAGGVKVGSYWFHSDDTSRIQQIGLVMFGANMPANLMWKTMNGTFVLMTPTLAGQIFQSIAISDQTIFAKAEYHKAQMEALPDPVDYDYTVGWPLIYGE